MIIKILGSGCKSCQKLEENTREALSQLFLDAQIEKISDFADIAKYNVMETPALIIDEKLVSYGKVNNVAEIVEFLK